MHIEHLSHWSGTSTVKCISTVMDTLGFQLWFLLHLVAVIMNTMILV